MVRHHVAKRTGLILIIAPMLAPETFGHRNLHMVNVPAIPNWLENAVAESKHENVLDCFFTQIMIDAINLIFFQVLSQLAVQRFGGLQVMSERFFDNDALPRAGCLSR